MAGTRCQRPVVQGSATEPQSRFFGRSLSASQEKKPMSLLGRLCTQLEDQVRPCYSLRQRNPCQREAQIKGAPSATIKAALELIVRRFGLLSVNIT